MARAPARHAGGHWFKSSTAQSKILIISSIVRIFVRKTPFFFLVIMTSYVSAAQERLGDMGSVCTVNVLAVVKWGEFDWGEMSF